MCATLDRITLLHVVLTRLHPRLPFRNPYVGSEDGEAEDTDARKAAEGTEAPKGKKSKSKEKGQKGKLEKDKPVLVDVDLNLSAYANAKK